MFDTQKWTYLPAYSDINKQIWRQKNRYNNWKTGLRDIFVDVMPQMQLNRQMKIENIVSVKICRPDDLEDGTDTGFCYIESNGTDINLITTAIDTTNDIKYYTRGGIDYILFLGNILLSDGVGGTYNLPVGEFFFEIKDSTNTWYSDLFSTRERITLGTLSGGINPNEGNYDIQNQTILNLT